MERRMLKALFLTWCATIVLTGCALTTDHIDLQYEPQPGVGPVPGAEAVSVNVQIADLRTDKNRVSCKKNGFGMEMAPIIANEDVTVTVRTAMETELRNRGFAVGGNDTVTVIGNLRRFYNDHKAGFFTCDAVADLDMGVTVKGRTGGIVYTREILAQGEERNTMLMSGENARIALNRALQEGMNELFKDQSFISALIEGALK
jgi:uncharacterized lipoprotein